MFGCKLFRVFGSPPGNPLGETNRLPLSVCGGCLLKDGYSEAKTLFLL
ncbi:hypothetical protein HMPREF3226_00185 [Prevotella corporis]|uniref:Uncharacterized protein n=1 Tax=Prevotella corporis TaxID=28128 RepID=A0A133QN12_9BACT|nr:hypothetical protein HMPREF3226_00185 [Prevotella corporis]